MSVSQAAFEKWFMTHSWFKAVVEEEKVTRRIWRITRRKAARR